jgi:hypothetical protein
VERLRQDCHVVWYTAEMATGVSDQDVLNLASHEQASTQAEHLTISYPSWAFFWLSFRLSGIFLCFKKDSRRASLAGMTPLDDADCHIAPLLSMMLLKESLNLVIIESVMPEVLNRASSPGFKPSGFPLNALREWRCCCYYLQTVTKTRPFCLTCTLWGAIIWKMAVAA